MTWYGSPVSILDLIAQWLGWESDDSMAYYGFGKCVDRALKDQAAAQRERALSEFDAFCAKQRKRVSEHLQRRTKRIHRAIVQDGEGEAFQLIANRKG